MNPTTTALAKRPCMALARLEPPPFAPWRGHLRQLLALFLARQRHRQIARAYGLLDPGPLDGHELRKATQDLVDQHVADAFIARSRL